MEEELAINVSWCKFGMPAGVMGVCGGCVHKGCIHIYTYIRVM